MARDGRSGSKTVTASESPRAVGFEEIAKVAYELFEQRGRMHGHDLEDWLEAERLVRERRKRRTGS